MKERVSFVSLAFENKKKKTRREKFLEEMDQVIPWRGLLKVIRKHYPKAGNGRQPMPLERMLRINSGTGFPIRQWRMRSMTANRGGDLPILISKSMWCRMKQRS